MIDGQVTSRTIVFPDGSKKTLGIMPSDTAIDWGQVIFKGLKLKGIYGREMFETWYKMTARVNTV